MHPLTRARLISARCWAFTDIDDTLTTDGAITRCTGGIGLIWKAAGCTWSPSLAEARGLERALCGQTWPVDAIVAGERAVAFTVTARQGLVKRYQQDETTRQRNYARMQEVLAQIEREVPGACRATDSPGRRRTSPSTTASSHLPSRGH